MAQGERQQMSASVRVVCRGCLRSVELSASAAEAPANQCPHCGGLIDSESLQVDEDAEGTDTSISSPVTDIGETIDWAKTWARGSLGSLGRFQLRERLGDGGFGQVFRAYDPRLDRDVAVKVLKQPNPTDRVMARFFREARAVARLDHPNIVAVHDAGFDGGRCWVAYQLVGGRPLWWYRDHHPMDATTVARIIRALADALDHSHHMGVVHRDLKPGNVLIDDQGRPRLIDFGLARRSDFESDLTRDGAIVGTPAYMSPEQALGHSRQVDERSDVYSLGVIFFELIHGHRPDEPNGVPDVVQRGRWGLSPLDSAVGGSLPRDSAIPQALQAICAKAMAKEPAARHPTARDLADELDLWLLQQRRDDDPKSVLVKRIVTGAISAILLSLGLLAAYGIWQSWSAAFAARRILGSIADQALPPPAVPASHEAGAIQLVGNRETHHYHLSTCKSVRLIKAANRVVLENAVKAAAQGFKPCSHCDPAGTPVRASQPPA
jgi:serine/threonine protein kinase